MDTGKVEILLITCNDSNDIDGTLDSIRAQNYPKERLDIYAVDFGSTDGTYEKLLRHDPYHFAVYQVGGVPDTRTMVAEAARLIKPGPRAYGMVLWAGDVIYPDFLSVCTRKMMAAAEKYPERLVCEADIKLKDGSIAKQKTLFEADRVFNREKDSLTYVDRGYDHYLGCFGDRPYTFNNKIAGIINSRYDWNSQMHIACDDTIIYVKDALLCLKEREVDDELGEILFRWDSVISKSRLFRSKWGKGLDQDFDVKAYRNLALYCLWRCRRRCGELATRELKDCFDMAGIIYPDISGTEEFTATRNMLFHK